MVILGGWVFLMSEVPLYTLSSLLPSQVIALSWPSEGAFGKKVLRDFPADDPKRYAWLRAARKSYQVRTSSSLRYSRYRS